MCVPHPIATMREKIALTGAVANGCAKKAYVRARQLSQSGLRRGARQGEGRSGVAQLRGPCGHDVMVDMPERLAEIWRRSG